MLAARGRFYVISVWNVNPEATRFAIGEKLKQILQVSGVRASFWVPFSLSLSLSLFLSPSLSLYLSLYLSLSLSPFPARPLLPPFSLSPLSPWPRFRAGIARNNRLHTRRFARLRLSRGSRVGLSPLSVSVPVAGPDTTVY